MAAHWRTTEGEIADYMNALPKIVCSRTLRSADWSNSTVVGDNVAAEIRDLKQQGDGSIFVFGSGNLSETLSKDGLFGEYRLAIVLVVLSGGRPLFGPGSQPQELALVGTTPLSNGCTILRYVPKKAL